MMTLRLPKEKTTSCWGDFNKNSGNPRKICEAKSKACRIEIPPETALVVGRDQSPLAVAKAR